MVTVLKFAVALFAGWLVLAAVQSAFTHGMQTAISNSDGIPAFAKGTSPTVNTPSFTYDPDCFAVGTGVSNDKPVNLNRCHAEEESARQAEQPLRPHDP